MKRFFVISLFSLMLSGCCSGKSWTFLVYLDGDNDLAPYNLQDMEEMKKGIGCNQIRVLVQFDQPDNVTAKRYEINKGKITELEDIGEVDMADGQTLTDFLLWTKTKLQNPDHTVLILSDHGNGWDQMVGPSPAKLSDRSLFEDYDSDKKFTPALHNHLVREAIEKANIDIDILGLDASIMGTIEAIYEFSGLADIIISSQEVGYSTGWDYDDVFSSLSDNLDMSLEDFSSMVVDSYRDYFEDTLYPSGEEASDQLYTIAAHRSAGVVALADSIGSFASNTKLALENSNPNELVSLIQASREDAQHIDLYNQPRVYVDIADFFTLLDSESQIPQLVQEATIASYHGKDRPNANGLSIVFFKLRDGSNNTYDKNYKDWDPETETGNKGKFINEFQWDEMMALYNSLAYPDLEL